MALPTPDAYNDAVQTPRLAFSDTELANGKVDCNGFGIPKALGGGFAITYRLSSSNGRSYAVRCFHKEVRNLQDRYHRIHSILKATQSPLFVGFEYQQNGIKVKSVGYPIVKMEWATGMTLGEYIEQNHQKRTPIEQLRSSFAQMEAELQQRGIAHGDLQNGNVLVSPQGGIRLVDYDGMFVPGMNTGGGAELGHKHFQHPHRNAASFGPLIDRFSFLVIDLSLWALALQPDLFRRFSTGENILFAANDYADPASSQVFQALKMLSDPTFQKALVSFAAICQSPFSSVPRLPDFLTARNIPTAPVSLPAAPPSSQKYIGALPVIDARKFGDVCQHVGDKVELIGQIVEVKAGSTRKRTPYVFINFGNWRDDCVRITVWSEGLKALGFTPDHSWHGQWIVINGLIDPVYHGKNRYKTIEYRSVGITLSDRSQLRKVPQEEALWRLGRGERYLVPSTTPAGPTVANKNRSILDKVNPASGKPPSPTPSVPLGTAVTRPPTVAPPPDTAKEKNKDILKTLVPAGPSRSGGASGPTGTSQPTKKATDDKFGYFIVVVTVIVITILFTALLSH